MGRRIRAVVFDLDQTLLNSWEVHREGVFYAAERAGLPRPPVDEIIAHITGSLERELKSIFNGAGDRVMEYYLEFYYRHHLELNRPFPGVPEALETLRRRGLRLAVLTNKRRSVGALELEHTGLARYLDVAVFRDDVGAMKPDPRGLWHVLRALGVSPQEAVLAGDVPGDIRCARVGGTASAATLWGALDAPAVLAEGPDLVWPTVEDMLTLA